MQPSDSDSGATAAASSESENLSSPGESRPPSPATGAPAPRPFWWGVYLIAVAGLAARLVVSLRSLNVPYPDEIFQYLEQGHRLAFGYGLVPWEFREGARSWLVPGAIAGVLRALDAIGLGAPGAYLPIVRGLLCLLSISLVFSCYVIGRRLASEGVGRLAALFAALWYELVYFAHKPLSDVLGAYALAAAFACLGGGRRRRRLYLLGALTATAAVLRVQLLPAALFVLLAVTLTEGRRALARAGLAFAAIVLLAGWFDQLTWGAPFASYLGSYRANVVEGMGQRYGEAPWSFYALCLLATSGGLAAAAMAWGLWRWRKTWILVGGIAAIVVPHAVIAHKEYRFVLAAIPLILVLVAQLARELEKALARLAPARLLRFVPVAAVAAVAVISFLGLLHALPGQRLAYDKRLLGRQAGLEAYLLIAREREVVGVLDMYQPWWASGGAAFMHQPVPIYHGADLQSGVLPRDQVHRYVSHLLCRRGQCRAEGFRMVARLGEAELLVQETLPPREPNPRYTWNVYEQEVLVSGPRRQHYRRGTRRGWLTRRERSILGRARDRRRRRRRPAPG